MGGPTGRAGPKFRPAALPAHKRARARRAAGFLETPNESTPFYSSESNGVLERKNKTLKDMMNIMLVSSGTSINLWEEVLFSVCHIQNIIPHKKYNKTLYKLWKDYVTNITYYYYYYYYCYYCYYYYSFFLIWL